MDKLGITELTKEKHILFHPSGSTQESREDVEVSKRLIECGKILGIEVLDSVIVGMHKGISLKEKGFI